MGEFLPERDSIGWSAPEGFPASLTPAGVFAQDAPNGLEVALAESPRRPSAGDLRWPWSKRRASQASPVLVVARYPAPRASGSRCAAGGRAADRATRRPSQPSQLAWLATALDILSVMKHLLHLGLG